MREAICIVRLSKRSIVQSVFIALLLLLLPGNSSGEQSTAAIMQQVYDAIAYLLPLSLRDPTEDTIWDHRLINDKLQTLKNASVALKQHTADRDQEFQLLASSFDELTSNAHKSFSNEWPEFAYFSMMDLVQHCVACHSRLPAPSKLFGQRLLARMDIRELPPADVVKIYIAVRQFDAALKSIEKTLMDPDLHPISADYGSLMIDYLQVAISAKRSAETAENFLRRYLERGDLPFYLKHRIKFWLGALEEFADELAAEPELAAATTIFNAADNLSRGPGNRVRAVHDIIAASIIRDYLSKSPESSAEELGKAYYMLGVIALRTMEPKSAVPEMELSLAASINADPGGQHALEAYALIEEYGYVHEEHLAAKNVSQTLIDMPALRALINQK